MSLTLLSNTTFEYAVLALTVLQMLNCLVVYPAASGIPVSLFALVALGIDRQPFWKWCLLLSAIVIFTDLVHICVVFSNIGNSSTWPSFIQWNFAAYILALPLKIYIAYFSKTKNDVAVPQNSSLSDGLVNQQQEQYVAPDHYTSKPAPQQQAAFSAPAYVPPPAASSYGTEAPSAFPSAFPSVAVSQVNANMSMLPANAA